MTTRMIRVIIFDLYKTKLNSTIDRSVFRLREQATKTRGISPVKWLVGRESQVQEWVAYFLFRLLNWVFFSWFRPKLKREELLLRDLWARIQTLLQCHYPLEEVSFKSKFFIMYFKFCLHFINNLKRKSSRSQYLPRIASISKRTSWWTLPKIRRQNNISNSSQNDSPQP